MERSLAILILSVDFSKALHEELRNLQVSNVDAAVKWRLITLILRIDIGLNTVDSVLIKQIPNQVFVLLSNSME